MITLFLFRFAFNWTCGCVVSERALIEIPSETCHKVFDWQIRELFHLMLLLSSNLLIILYHKNQKVCKQFRPLNFNIFNEGLFHSKFDDFKDGIFVFIYCLLFLFHLILQCGIEINKEDIIIINGNAEDIKKLTDQMKKRKERLKKEKKKKTDNSETNSKNEEKSSKNNEKLSKNKRPAGDNDKQNKKIKISSDQTESKNKFEDSNSYKKLFHKNSEKKDKAHWVTYNPYYN